MTRILFLLMFALGMQAQVTSSGSGGGGGSSPFTGGTVANPIIAPSVSTNGAAAGSLTMTAGNVPTAPTNSVVIAAPSAVTAPYVFSLPAGPPGSSPLTISCTGTTATICSWIVAGTGWTGSFQTQSAGGVYSDWSFNGNHSDGTRLGCLGGSSVDMSLYCDVPSGGSIQFRINNVHIATFSASSFILPMGIQAQNYANNYDDISFNGNHADGTRFGFVWDNTFIDKNWYFDVTSGGNFKFRVGGTDLPSATVSIGCGTLTFTNGLLTGKTGTC